MFFLFFSEKIRNADRKPAEKKQPDQCLPVSCRAALHAMPNAAIVANRELPP